MENKVYFKIFDKILNNTEELDSVEKTTIISIYTMIVVYCMIHVLFLIFFRFNKIPEMVFVNLTSIIICIWNLYVLTDVKRLTLALFLWIANSCYFILATTYLLGYTKNAVVFLPILLLLIHFVFPKKKKYLIINTCLVLLTYFLHFYIKYFTVPKYFDLFNFIDAINNFSALVLATLIIYLKSMTDELVNKYTMKQVDSLVEEVDALTTEACFDFLTGLLNRRAMERELLSEDFTNSYLVIADIDHFKVVNDKYGHNCGDYVLKEVSNYLRTTFRNVDLVCRWGGEEFLIFLKSPEQTYVIEKLERTRQFIEEVSYDSNGVKFHITITFGFTSFNKELSLEENIENADKALYY